jgi:precorrin-6B methylase 2
VRERLRDLLDNRLGAPGRALLAVRTRARAERLLEGRGAADAAAAIAASTGSVVTAGPFSGLLYVRRFGDIVHAAKLVGSYEREVHAVTMSIVGRAPSLVVNIGSGDGYYAVGLARLLPHATIVAVDPDPLATRSCRDTARRNGVRDRVQHAVRVDATGLEALLRKANEGRTACVVDCEGFEDELLDPVRAPTLATSDLLVETHDFAQAGVTARLMERFGTTHRVVRIEVTARDGAPDAYPSLRGLEPAARAALLDEYRHMPQSWLAMFARAGD